MNRSRRKTIDLNPTDLATVSEILHSHVPNREVRAIGSRIQGRALKFSDLDLVIMGDFPLTVQELADIRDAFSESDLPIKVDLIDWATTDPDFQEIIASDYAVVQDSKAVSRSSY